MNHHNPPFTTERLLQTLKSFPDASAYIVAFSGGADSTALLHAIGKVRHELGVPLSAIHVNHGLHEHADLWQSQCEFFCRENGIKLDCLRVYPENRPGESLESEARQLRYEAMSAQLEPGFSLLTAHHADDQAETLLLNLMRGSGVDGLSSMPQSRPLGRGMLQRPLLAFQNCALRQYLHENNVEWTEDPSNRHLDYDRNFVRHELIPTLEQRWPGVAKRLLLTRRAMTDARVLLERLADDRLEKDQGHPFVLPLSTSLCTNPELFKLVIRRWMKRSGVSSIPAYRLESFHEQVNEADSESKAAVQWDGWSLRWYKQKLWLHPDRKIPPCPLATWPQRDAELDLGEDTGRLVLRRKDDKALENHDEESTLLPGPGLRVGSRMTMPDTGIKQGLHHKKLKNLFQEAGIPPWLRDNIPLCQLNDEIVAMGDWCFSGRFASWLSANNIELNWHPGNPLLGYIHAQKHIGRQDS